MGLLPFRPFVLLVPAVCIALLAACEEEIGRVNITDPQSPDFKSPRVIVPDHLVLQEFDTTWISAEAIPGNAPIAMWYWARNGIDFQDSNTGPSIKIRADREGTSQVKVKVRDSLLIFSSEAATFIDSRKPYATPVNPPDGDTTKSKIIRFSWKPGVHERGYRLLVDTLRPPLALAAEGLTSPTFEMPLAGMLGGRDYFWQVLSYDSPSLEGAVSGPISRFFLPALANVLVADSLTVALWQFREDRGTQMLDWSGNKNHGTLHGTTWDRDRQAGYASFDGRDDWAEIPRCLSYRNQCFFLQRFMLEAVFLFEGNAVGDVLHLNQEDGEVQVHCDANSVSVTTLHYKDRPKTILGFYSGSQTIPLSMRFIRDESAGYQKFYLDGRLIDSSSSSTSLWGNILRRSTLGAKVDRFGNAATGHFKGRIFEVKLSALP